MGRRKNGADGYEAVCALGVTLHTTLTFLAFLHLTLFSREFSLFQNLQNEKQPTSTGSVSIWGVVDSQQNTFAPNLRTVTSETGLWVKLNSSSNLLEPPWNTSERLLTQKLHSSGLQNYLRIQRTIHSSPFITWIFVSKQGLLQVDQLATACGRPGQDGPPVS